MRVDSLAPPRSSRPSGCLTAVYLAATAAARLRVAEGLRLRVKDVDLAGGKVEVRGGKGDKDRVVTLPRSLVERLKAHRETVKLSYEADRREGQPGVWLPGALEEKLPHAGESWPWYWMFPSRNLAMDPRTGVVRRHHLHDLAVSRELARAARLAGLEKKVTAHTLRHSVDSVASSGSLTPALRSRAA